MPDYRSHNEGINIFIGSDCKDRIRCTLKIDTKIICSRKFSGPNNWILKMCHEIGIEIGQALRRYCIQTKLRIVKMRSKYNIINRYYFKNENLACGNNVNMELIEQLNIGIKHGLKKVE